jgi:hypothetical protein
MMETDQRKINSSGSAAQQSVHWTMGIHFENLQ